ncbi:MAG: hypothetical protein KME40_33885 [Komarekiella atlantica HA4396-MV6]|jgi:hypothetical protein|nr:hypothetical protein [Komarekiella atlantica HA4396-MV6]
MNSPLPSEPPQNALEALIELQDYYTNMAQEYERLLSICRSQLTHVEALVSGLTSAYKVVSKNLAPVEEDNRQFTTQVTDSEENFLEDIPVELLQLDDSGSEKPDGALTPELPEPPIFPLIETPPPSQQRSSLTLPLAQPTQEKASLHGVEISMLPQYQSLTRPEAIEQVLAEEIGTSVHIDFIVRSLYGELEPEAFKVVKGRVQSSLTQGKESNKWFSVPGEPGYFTLSLTLLSKEQTKNSSPQATRKNNKPIKPQTKEIPMLKAYEGQFLIDALSTFLEQNAGKIFNVSEVITGIYGELNAADVREVRNKVLNELSRGYRTGRFSRVPNQIGFYTWDYKLVNE